MNCQPLLLLIPLAFMIDIVLVVYIYLDWPRRKEELERKQRQAELNDFLAKLREDYDSDVYAGGSWESWETTWDKTDPNTP